MVDVLLFEQSPVAALAVSLDDMMRRRRFLIRQLDVREQETLGDHSGRMRLGRASP